jgi:DNA-binding CsgD family transcriptional regulator
MPWMALLCFEGQKPRRVLVNRGQQKASSYCCLVENFFWIARAAPIQSGERPERNKSPGIGQNYIFVTEKGPVYYRCFATGVPGRGVETEKLTMTLTSREWEVARLVAKGLSNKEIARHLNAREGTVKIHLHNIYEKLAIKNRTVLALRVTEPEFSEDQRAAAVLAEPVIAA